MINQSWDLYPFFADMEYHWPSARKKSMFPEQVDDQQNINQEEGSTQQSLSPTQKQVEAFSLSEGKQF